MNDIIARLPEQIEEALSIGKNADFTKPDRTFSSVLVCGLGGSGIGGAIISLLVKNKLKIPFLCISDYDIPAWVNDETLVIASSYSGNTEETLTSVKSCVSRGAEVAVITSGGELLEMAKTDGWNHFVVPGGEQPRAMLAYSLVQQIFILVGYGLIDTEEQEQLKTVPAFIREHTEEIQVEAMRIAKVFHGRRPIIYAGNDFAGIAVRWRQQINENGKELCWHHVFPEMTHNELVGWAGGSSSEVPLFLKSNLNHPRTNKRWSISKEVLGKKTEHVLETEAKGSNHVLQNFYLIHLGDWVSYNLSELKNIDAEEVEVISHLKEEMSRFKSEEKK